MKPLDDYNAAKAQAGAASPGNGIACPECGAELQDTNNKMALPSDPPKYRVHCPHCGFHGTRY